MKTKKAAALALALTMIVSGCSSNTKSSSNKHKGRASERRSEETNETNNGNGESFGIGNINREHENPYFEKIDNAVILYYYGHSCLNMELFETVKPTEITLNESQIKELEKAFEEIEEYATPDEGVLYPLTDYCKLRINDDMEIYMSERSDTCAFIKDEEYYFADKDFTDIVYDAIEQYEEENAKSGMFNKKVTNYWRNEQNNSVEYAFDIENFPELKNIKYYSFECSIDPNIYGDITDNFMFEDNSVLMIFEGVGDAFYVQNGFEYYITFEKIGEMQKSIDEYLAKKAEMGDNDFSSNPADSELVISYNGNNLTLPEDVNAEDIISILNESDFSHFDYLDDMDFGDCVEVSAGNGTFYIPTDSTDGNTYYVAEDGVRYLAWLDFNTRQLFLDII